MTKHEMLQDHAELEILFRDCLNLLRDLADLQNDAPLETERKEWEATMEKVYEFLDQYE